MAAGALGRGGTNETHSAPHSGVLQSNTSFGWSWEGYPTPAPTHQSAQTVLQYRQDPRLPENPQLVDLICSYDWDCGRAVAIFSCESVHFRGDVVYGPTVSPTNDRGLAQINVPSHMDKLYAVTGTYDVDLYFDPAINLKVAWMIYEDSGWGPWSCAR